MASPVPNEGVGGWWELESSTGQIRDQR